MTDLISPSRSDRHWIHIEYCQQETINQVSYRKTPSRLSTQEKKYVYQNAHIKAFREDLAISLNWIITKLSLYNEPKTKFSCIETERVNTYTLFIYTIHSIISFSWQLLGKNSAFRSCWERHVGPLPVFRTYYCKGFSAAVSFLFSHRMADSRFYHI